MPNLDLLLIDNYDSFTFNLQHLIAARPGVSLSVVRNDAVEFKDIDRGCYDGVVIGPGPGSPEDAAYFGQNKELILNYGTSGLPILGVCLGFQGIFHCFGGQLKVTDQPMHGKVSVLERQIDSRLLKSIPTGACIMRYHSIVLETQRTPDQINITATAQDPELNGSSVIQAMALEHRDHPIYGLQFHPESFATEHGYRYIQNFLDIISG